jgi:hypothetical protein
MIGPTETYDIRPLTADETLVVSGGILPPDAVAMACAKQAAAEALIEGVVNFVKSSWPL